MKFCKDFNLVWNKVKIAEVFKKISVNSKELFFEDFKSTLWRVLETRDGEEIDKLKKRLKEIRKITSNKNKPKVETSLPPKNKDLQEVQKISSDIKDKPEQQYIQETFDKQSIIEGNFNQSLEKVEEKVIPRPKGGDPK